MSEMHYFLGASSPSGFHFSAYDLTGDTCNTVYILKGTAGSGKSTLMKKISQAFSECDREIFHCSADPDSLDAVYIRDKGFLIIDGTSPHCLDPVYPKAVETIIDLGAYLDSGYLSSRREEIIRITDAYSGFHKRNRLILSAADAVIGDIMNNAREVLNIRKTEAFTERTVRHMIAGKPRNREKGRLMERQLSALTMNGYATYAPLCGNIYLINDEYAAAADLFLKKAAERFTDAGYDVYESRCLISSREFTEHIFIPELDAAFMTAGLLSDTSVQGVKKTVRFSRFYSPVLTDKSLPYRARLKFGKRALKELMEESSKELKAAKSVHDKLEEYYIKAADFDSLNRLSYKLISAVKSMETDK